MLIKEHTTLPVKNPITEDFEKPITEAAIGDLRVTDVRAVYPVMCAINADRLTKNFTFYPKESLIGKKDVENATGYHSFVTPTGKPVIREHRLQDSGGFFGGGVEAEPPMGRVIYAAFKGVKKGDPQTQPKNKLCPGSVEGCGWMMLVPAITEPEAVQRILGGAYHTISIGSEVGKVIESISGIDIVDARKKGEEMPIYSKGQTYKVDKEERLSYWSMFDLKGVEVSYVNNPSDVRAFNKEKDIGEEGIRILLGEKKPGTSEFSFYDAKTLSKVESFLPEEEFEVDPTFNLVDSATIPTFYRVDKTPNITESMKEIEKSELLDAFLEALAEKFMAKVSPEKEENPEPELTPEETDTSISGEGDAPPEEATELSIEDRLLKFLEDKNES